MAWLPRDIFWMIHGTLSNVPSPVIRVPHRPGDSLFMLMEAVNMLDGGILHRLDTSCSSAANCNTLMTRNRIIVSSIRPLQRASAILILQKLWSTSSWNPILSANIPQNDIDLKQEEQISTSFHRTKQWPDWMSTLISSYAGYCERGVNECMWSVLGNSCSLLNWSILRKQQFKSVYLVSLNTDHDQRRQWIDMLEKTLEPTSLADREELITHQCQKPEEIRQLDIIVATQIRDRRQILRFIMCQLQHNPEHWLQEFFSQHTVLQRLVIQASSSISECWGTVLGSNAKILLKSQCLRRFCQAQSKLDADGVLSLIGMEVLAWNAWERLDMQGTPSVSWRQVASALPAIPFEILGGEVEINDLTIQALQHFPTIKLRNIMITSNSGLWFYEVVILTGGLMQIGYVENEFTADAIQGHGVGDHVSSWAFDGLRKKKWNVTSYDYGEMWQVGDVVGVLLDTDRLELSFFLNGKFLGVAFSGISVAPDSLLYPAISLNAEQLVQFNFGTQFDHTRVGIGIPTEYGMGFAYFPCLNSPADQNRLQPISLAIAMAGGEKSKVQDIYESELPSSRSFVGGSEIDEEEGDKDEIDSLGIDYTSIAADYLGSTEMFDRNIAQLRAELKALESFISQDGLNYDDPPKQPLSINSTSFESAEGNEALHNIDIEDDYNLQMCHQNETFNSSHLVVADEVSSHSKNLAIEEPSNSALAPLSRIDPTSSTVISRLDHLDTEQSTTDNFTLGEMIGMSSNYKVPNNTTSNYPLRGEDEIPSECNPLQLCDDNDQFKHWICQHFKSDTASNVNDAYNFTSDYHRIFSSTISDILPHCVVLDSILCVLYARQCIMNIIVGIASNAISKDRVYELLLPMITSSEARKRFSWLFRSIVTSLQKSGQVEHAFQLENHDRALKLQESMILLLQHELKAVIPQNTACNDESQIKFPLFQILYEEVQDQMIRAIMISSIEKEEQLSDQIQSSIDINSSWTIWVIQTILQFIERTLVGMHDNHQISAIRSSYLITKLSLNSCLSTPFFQLILTLLTTTTLSPWRVRAIVIAGCILKTACVVRKKLRILQFGHNDGLNLATCPKSTLVDLIQVNKILELFSIRYRKENQLTLLFSECTQVIFWYLVQATKALKLKMPSLLPSSSSKTSRLVIESCSSTRITILWNGPSNNPTQDSINEDIETMHKDELIVHVYLESPFQLEDCQQTADWVQQLMISSVGRYTIHGLTPDTIYTLRIHQLITPSTFTDSSNTIPIRSAYPDIQFQTPPAPPFAWDNSAKGSRLNVLHQNLSVSNMDNKKWYTIRALVGFTTGIHEWQVRIDKCISKNIFIGICTQQATLENYIGSDAYGYGYLANRAIWHNKSKLHTYGDLFKQGDIIHVMLDCDSQCLSFARNGEPLGVAVANLQSTISDMNDRGLCQWFPAISLYNKDDQVTLIPSSADSSRNNFGGSQFASMVTKFQSMQFVLEYIETMMSTSCTYSSDFMNIAVEFYMQWHRNELVFRELERGEMIPLRASHEATAIFGLYHQDVIHTPKGPCRIIGEHRHELWYEIEDDDMDNLQYWNLSTCNEMVNDTSQEYPIERMQQSKAREVEEMDVSDDIVQSQFVKSQKLPWTIELDGQIVCALSSIAENLSLRDPFHLKQTNLNESDIGETLKNFIAENIVPSNRSISMTDIQNVFTHRAALLLILNQHLYRVIRFLIPSLDPRCDHHIPNINADREIASPRFPSSSDRPSKKLWQVVLRLAFPHIRHRLFQELVAQSRTLSVPIVRTSIDLIQVCEGDELATTIRLSYPFIPCTPFWTQENNKATQECKVLNHTDRIETTVFYQFSKQMATISTTELRREHSSPLASFPISMSFNLVLNPMATNHTSKVEINMSSLLMERLDPSLIYLQLFEQLAMEIQSPLLPLFVPIRHSVAVSTSNSLVLGINVDLLKSPTCKPFERHQILLWYYHVGQIIGMAWRNRFLLPFQYLDPEIWAQLMVTTSVGSTEISNTRESEQDVLTSIRHGLVSIVPSQCLQLVSPQIFRRCISDIDITFMTTLEYHSIYDHTSTFHQMFWNVVRRFTSLERRMFRYYIANESMLPLFLEAERQPILPNHVILELRDAKDPPDQVDMNYPLIEVVNHDHVKLYVPRVPSEAILHDQLITVLSNLSL